MLERINQDALNFFLYESLRIIATDQIDTIEDKCIEKAYTDATMMGAYNTSLNKQTKVPSQKAKEEGIGYLKKRLQKVQELSSKKSYDDWHHTTCLELRGFYQNRSLTSFTYGNAQKWVNMTMKYLYLLRRLLQHDELSYIDKITGYLHVPVDSYIIEAVWSDQSVPLPTIDEKLLKDGSRGEYASEKVIAWGNWEPDSKGNHSKAYVDFQAAIKERAKREGFASPIEWEGAAWIEQARMR